LEEWIINLVKAIYSNATSKVHIDGAIVILLKAVLGNWSTQTTLGS
jgi:hypothetical protein